MLIEKNKNTVLKELNDMSFLRNFGATEMVDGKIKLTNTGLFLFGTQPGIEKHAPFFGIKYAFIHNNKNAGTVFFGGEILLKIIKKTTDKIMEDYPLHKNLYQVIYQFLLYAFLYQDYEKENYIYVYNRDGILEISYTGNDSASSALNLAIPVPVQRNRLLEHALKEMKFLEFSGNGYIEMVEELLKNGYECPKFPPMDRKTRIILPIKKRDKKFPDFYKQAHTVLKRELSFYEIIALKLLYNYGELTTEILEKETPLKARSAQKLAEKINETFKQF